MTESNQPSLQRRFGHYKVVEEVGAGGLGKVFKGLDDRTGRVVAIKVLHDKYATSRKFLGIFHRELLTISRLHHKHLVSYLDSGFDPPNCFIVTEFVDGWSCYGFMKQRKRVPPIVALSIVMDILQGIDYLHLHDTIHSDLSMPNVMIERTGRILVTDFGLACQLEVEDYKNYMVGTPGYYSPEHVSEVGILPQTDLYCTGLILYELIAGTKAVIASQDRTRVVQSMKKIVYDPIKISDPKLQAMVVKLLKSALTFNATSRVESAEAFMFEIYKILKKYNIRYTRYAIKKYLIDTGMVKSELPAADQDIYVGFSD